ncbi:MAG: hypothetical protein ACHQ6U_02045 [Thermodesulfobacteriota bacterium]|jgi:hypothetical protein
MSKRSKAVELIQIGFNVSIDAGEYKDDMESILEAARTFNSTIVFRNVPDTMLNDKFLKKLKSHSHKIIIEV